MKTYKSKLDFFKTEKAIKLVKDTFQKKLAEKLDLIRVSAPRFLVQGTGLQDDLAGTQEPVSFMAKGIISKLEVVHSLAKWKRFALGKYGFKIGKGIYTDMDAIRKDEVPDDIHSIYVDQWDWEKIITKDDRKLDFLKEIVRKIYSVLIETAELIEKEFPEIESRLPKTIHFVHSEELEEKYPDLISKEREDVAAKEFGAIFLIGIGYPLKSGEPHDLRAADYDDWSTKTEKGHGLCGDIIVWDKTREKSLELSSMGIRVDKAVLIKQLEMSCLKDRKELEFHKAIIEDKIPLTVGGGIGQSRLCMFLLHKAHIGEVQSSVWPKEVEKDCKEKGIILL